MRAQFTTISMRQDVYDALKSQVEARKTKYGVTLSEMVRAGLEAIKDDAVLEQMLEKIRVKV